MPRKGPAPKRPLDVDPVYGSQLVTQLVSKVLQDGKKQVAQRIVYGALEGCREKTGTDPVVIDYLTEGWTRPQLLALFAAAGLRPRDALRSRGTPAAELGLLEDLLLWIVRKKDCASCSLSNVRFHAGKSVDAVSTIRHKRF